MYRPRGQMLPFAGRQVALSLQLVRPACPPNRTIFKALGVSLPGAPNPQQQYHERKILPYVEA
jgi:hypothetical protein